ncbi:MAG: hypothetical protein HC772_15550 [Leptolyngbyaceae cyanobacterium CRU_2_3]|nr:hypothetical protein [Leptolyngbyaceae cyanobacterium CRU_2_3]
MRVTLRLDQVIGLYGYPLIRRDRYCRMICFRFVVKQLQTLASVLV